MTNIITLDAPLRLKTDVWAIRHKPTGKFLPMLKGFRGRGGTFLEPLDPEHRWPRLFNTERGANNALTMWLKGRFETARGNDGFTGEYYEETCIMPVADRRREEMEVVHLQLKLEG